MERSTFFADILLPLPLKGTFTYRVPKSLDGEIQVGQRAVVPFGRNKVYAGLVKRVHTDPPKAFQARYIDSLLDIMPVVTPMQFRFWEWLSDYYMCSQGEVMQAALPPAMKLAGETRIVVHPDAGAVEEPLNENEHALLDALANKKQLTMGEASLVIGGGRVLPLVKTMLEKGLVLLKEDLEDPWRPKTENMVDFAPGRESEENLREIFDQLEKRAPRQLELLMSFLKLSGQLESGQKEVTQHALVNSIEGGQAAFQSLLKKGIFRVSQKQTSRFSHLDASPDNIQFNEFQQQAYDTVTQGFLSHKVVLLHGVTSSGKTELYIRLIRETLEKGQQVLYLLPEIALTAQIIDRLQAQFGNRAGIYHSRFNPMERSEVWNNLLLGGIASDGETISYDLVLGPRSALFLPFKNLGLIIIDEEHEPSFKQQEPAPRYHARDAAIALASMAGARVLLGSATPSIESFFNARTGKYGYAELRRRHGGVQMPEILVADIRKEGREKTMRSHFSSLLYEHMAEALGNREQVILFQNRRGFSLRLECGQCDWLPECHQCDVSMVYHKKVNKLKCHYCGHTASPPVRCPSCGSTSIKMKGFGTEKVEEEIPLYFPEVRVARMDLDTTRSRHAYREILSAFESHKIDVLVGTQMVSKGLDFSNVSLVGVLNADNMLSFPDFRAHERAYQLMAQVSGRAGRNQKRGKVIIQAYNPLHSVIRQVIENDYEGMYESQIVERKNFHYPPFIRLIQLTLQHRESENLNQGAASLAAMLRKVFPKKVLGPEYPLVARVRNMYLKNILVKMDRNPQLPEARKALLETVETFRESPEGKSVRVIINVDP
jgi:primosomal protein N' (replication factor Y) (superfamily II helicase)